MKQKRIGNDGKPFLEFPCGARYGIKNGNSDIEKLVTQCHRNRSGSLRLLVWARQATPPQNPDGTEASCLWDCPKKGRHRKVEQVREWGGGFAGSTPNRSVNVTCYARIMQRINGVDVDVTPAGDTTCLHCREQRAYVAACKQSAKAGSEEPDRIAFGEKWRRQNR